MSEWQPIETAPSAQEILCYWANCGMMEVAERLNGEWFDPHGDERSKPTHWMPLPAPPTKQQGTVLIHLAGVGYSPARAMPTIDEQIADAELHAAHAAEALQAAQARVNTLYVERSSQKHDIRPGDKVQGTRSRVGIVNLIYPDRHRNSEPSVEVFLLKKDGSRGTRTAKFYSWMVIERVPR